MINIQIINIITALLRDVPREVQSSSTDKTMKKNPKFETKQNQLCSFGAINLVLQVLTTTKDDPETIEAALQLGIELLAGGNHKTQERIRKHFASERNGHVFFALMVQHMRVLQTTLVTRLVVREYTATSIYFLVS